MNKNIKYKKYINCLSKANNFNKIAKKYATGHFSEYKGSQDEYNFDRIIIDYCYNKKTQYIKKAINLAEEIDSIYGIKDGVVFFETKEGKQISFYDYNNNFSNIKPYNKDYITEINNIKTIDDEDFIIEYFYNDKIINYSKNEKSTKTFFNFCFNNILKEKCFDKKNLKKYFKDFKENNHEFFKNGYFIQTCFLGWKKCTNKKELNKEIKELKKYQKELNIIDYNFKELEIKSIKIIENKILIIETDYRCFDDDVSFWGDNLILIEL